MDLVIQLYLYDIESEQHPYQKQAKQIRQMEIDECFLRNLHHPLIQTVHVFCETEAVKDYFTGLAKQYKQEMKCLFIPYGKQPTYAEFVRYVKETIEDNHIVCIQNSDIYIDHGMSREFLFKALRTTPDTLITLTRHEHTDNEHSRCDESTCPLIWNYMGSHDTFIFQTPIPDSFPYENVSIQQNLYGAEAVFLKAWKDSGKQLMNPCFDIRIFHRHNQRVTFGSYATVADGYLCNANPIAPEGRKDIQSQLKTIFKS